jgi:hypothetical protein
MHSIERSISHSRFASHTFVSVTIAGSFAACSNADVSHGPGHAGAANAVVCGEGGGAAAGPQDDHCVDVDGGPIVQVTSQAECRPDAAEVAQWAEAGAGGADSGTGPDGAALPCYQDLGAYGPTLYNASGGEDDCKYDVAWSSSPSSICRNAPVSFTVSATLRTNHAPLTAASVLSEVLLDDNTCMHPSPSIPGAAVENPPGTYEIGPIVFDAPGRWLVRFHFYESCYDLSPESPHGHAAFWIDVP